MTRFFLALVATGVATLIGAFVIIAFRLPDPILHRPRSLRAAPTHERTLIPLPESGEPSGPPAGRVWAGGDPGSPGRNAQAADRSAGDPATIKIYGILRSTRI